MVFAEAFKPQAGVFAVRTREGEFDADRYLVRDEKTGKEAEAPSLSLALKRLRGML